MGEKLSYKIPYNCLAKRLWDYLVMLFACWNVFLIPLNLAFDMESTFTSIMDSIVDMCFILDIFVTFRTTYLDDNFDEVMNSKLIAIKYLKGRFIIDLMSAIPFDTISLMMLEERQAEQLQILNILKWVRVLRLNKIILYLNVRRQAKDSMRMAKVVFYLLVYVHTTACIWYYVISIKKEWFPLKDFIYGWKGA